MSLELRNINVTIGKKQILSSIHLQINTGEFISILGPSGCGKSTLLKTIAGLQLQSDGTILMNQHPIDSLAPHLRKTVIVFQDLRLFPHMTALENVAFPLKMCGISKKSRLKESLALLDKVELANMADRKITQMSGGQLQRIALARALAAKPDILLLDEPFSSLDDTLRKNMGQLLLTLHKDYNMTTILVTHDQQEALMLSQRIAIMSKGHILEYASPKQLYNTPITIESAQYFSPFNKIKGIIQDGTFLSSVISFKTVKANGPYTAIIRISSIHTSLKPGPYEIIHIDYLGNKYQLQVKKNEGMLTFEYSGEEEPVLGSMIQIDINKEQILLYGEV